MSVRLLLFLSGRMALLLGEALCIPMIFCFFVPGSQPLSFALPAVFLGFAGVALTHLNPLPKVRLGIRESAFLLLVIWLLLALVGMMPYVLAGQLGWMDAAFESISNFTTTGATCITADMPRPLLLWRSMTEWIGGLSAMVLLVTVMPQVSGCFGISFALDHHISLSPMLSRMRRSGGKIAMVYAVLTLLSCFFYWLGGLGWFDALNWAMVTLSTSGCYTTEAALSEHSIALETAAVLSMLLASLNFVLYLSAVRHRNVWEIARNVELRVFFGILGISGCLVAWKLYQSGIYGGMESFRYGFFQVISFASTTGFEAVDLNGWPDFTKMILFLLAFIGGCMGSPAGGFKVLRILILVRAAFAEMRRTLHPHMLVHISIGGIFVPFDIVIDILGFFFLYFSIFFLFMLLIAFSGPSLLDAMGIAAACINSMGAATMLYGGAGDFVSLPTTTKFLCCCLMILGKLEIFAFLLVLQTSLRRLRHKW